MKRLLLFTLGLLFFVNALSQIENTYFGFRKNPKEIIKRNRIIEEKVYSYTFNKRGVKDSALINTYTYDTLGNLVYEKIAKIKNYEESITTYANTYNTWGKLSKQITERRVIGKRSFEIAYIDEYEYDSSGNEVHTYHYNKDTTRLTIEHKIYNDENQIVQLQTKINNNDSYISRLYYYNADNGLSKVEAFDNNGEVIFSYIYEYDKVLNKKTEYLENRDGKIMEGEYFYNIDMQCIKENGKFKGTTLTNGELINYDYLKTIENIYNQDKTLFESNVYLDEKKVQMNRHFYF
jgi:hypothetical protein